MVAGCAASSLPSPLEGEAGSRGLPRRSEGGRESEREPGEGLRLHDISAAASHARLFAFNNPLRRNIENAGTIRHMLSNWLYPIVSVLCDEWFNPNMIGIKEDQFLCAANNEFVYWDDVPPLQCLSSHCKVRE